MKGIIVAVLAEAGMFNVAEVEVRPFRVAVSCNFNGGDYWYGSHTDYRTDYADTTIGWAYSRKEGLQLLIQAARECEERNDAYHD